MNKAICHNRRAWLLKRLSKIKKLYPTLSSIYGPCKCVDDGRYRLGLVLKSGKTLWRQYAKVKMELKLGKRLHKNRETVDHIDDNVANDKYSNLQILTRKENVDKGFRTGALCYKQLVNYTRSNEGRKASQDRWLGERNTNAKLSDKLVYELRRQFKSGIISKKQIAIKGNFTSTKMVRAMLAGRTYKNAGGPLTSLPDKIGRPKAHTEKTIMRWVKMRRKGFPWKQVAEHFGVNVTTVIKKAGPLI